MKVTPSSHQDIIAAIHVIRTGETMKTIAPMIHETTKAKTSPVRKASLAVCKSPSPSFMPIMHWQPTQVTMANAIRNP